MYQKYGIDQTLQIMDGVFAFVMIDTNTNQIFVARDTYGVRPLFVNKSVDDLYTTYAFASEIKSLCNINNSVEQKITQFEPGVFSIFKYSEDSIQLDQECCFSGPNSFCVPHNNRKPQILENIYNKLYQAVSKRVDNTERDIACLLSGGLDSSLVAAMVKSIHKGDLHTWTIGFEGSEDLKYAQKVADHIGSIHHSIEVSEQEFLDAIPEVIFNIESYDTTTVRASVGNWLICKKISEQSSAKVIFNGDGADEVMGGYLYFHKAPGSMDFDRECRKLLSQIHFFDVLRSDRSISSHGLEARTPFLDRAFVEYYLSISCEVRNHALNGDPEKHLLREAVKTHNPNLLPPEILFRTKEAFSDGVSKLSKSWYQTIQDYVKEHIFSHTHTTPEDIINNMNPYVHNRPKTLEQLYYRDIFSQKFPTVGVEKVIPHFWMPNFVKNATDASARTLDIYKEKNNMPVL